MEVKETKSRAKMIIRLTKRCVLCDLFGKHIIYHCLFVSTCSSPHHCKRRKKHSSHKGKRKKVNCEVNAIFVNYFS